MKNFLKFIFLITVFFSTNLISQNIQLKTVIEEFEVKTWEDGPESAELTNHEVSGHKDGNYIVYWKGDVERDYESRYYGNLYNNEGILLKKNIRFFKELSLNDYSLVDFSPKIIFNRDNSFKVFGICKDDGYYVVYEEYDRYGDLVKGWTKIFILSYLDRFIVSSDSTGNFIVANENRYLNRGIFVQKFDIDGNRINEIKPISSGNSPKICINNKGDFLAAWTESTIYTKKVGQLFNSNCDPISEIFTIQDSLQYFNSNSNNFSITYNKNNFIFSSFSKLLNNQINLNLHLISINNTDSLISIKIDENLSLFHNVLFVNDSTNFIFGTNYEIFENGKVRSSVIGQKFNLNGSIIGNAIIVYSSTDSLYKPTYFEDDIYKFSYAKLNLQSHLINDNKILLTWERSIGNNFQNNKNKGIYGITYNLNGQVSELINMSNSPNYSRIFSSDIYPESNGNFKIMWSDNREQDEKNINNIGVYQKEFDADGKIANEETDLQLKRYPLFYLKLSNDNFVLIYYEYNPNQKLFSQIFSKNGEKIGEKLCFASIDEDSEMRFSSLSYTKGISLKDKYFLTWGEGTEYNENIYVQLFANNGVPLDTIIKINSNSSSETRAFDGIQIRSSKSKEFIITWNYKKDYFNEDSVELMGQYFDNEGNKVGNNFSICNRTYRDYNYKRQLNTQSSDLILVPWKTILTSYFDAIVGQFFIKDGISFGSKIILENFSVLTQRFYDIYRPIVRVEHDEEGNFVVSWDDNGELIQIIYIQFFNKYGGKIGYTIENFNEGKLGIMSEYKLKLSNGKLYLTWVSDGRIFAKVFSYQDILVDLNEEIENLPKSLSLYQNYPNPFNPTTKIKYSIPANEKRETANVKIIVYDVLGKEIKTLVNENKSPGNYEVEFNASYLSSGIYFYKIQAGKFIETKKMILIK